MAEDWIVVGAFAGAFGVRGDVRVKSFCAVPEDIVGYAPLKGADGTIYDRMELSGQAKGALVVRVAGIATKEQADAIKGQEILADRSLLPSLPDDEFYHTDLIGLSVYDTGGSLIGTVKNVLNHGASDLLEVQEPQSSKTILLPFTQAVVPTVDLTAGRIVADPPDGLI